MIGIPIIHLSASAGMDIWARRAIALAAVLQALILVGGVISLAIRDRRPAGLTTLTLPGAAYLLIGDYVTLNGSERYQPLPHRVVNVAGSEVTLSPPTLLQRLWRLGEDMAS